MAKTTAASITKNSGKPAPPCLMVIFGAGGDLTKRLLLPSLYNLLENNLLPEQFGVLGITLDQEGDEQFRQQMRENLQQFATCPIAGTLADKLIPHFYALAGDFNDANLYEQIKERMTQVEGEIGTGGNVLFYLATPPQFFGVIVKHLGDAGLTQEENECWRRVVIEKPFGHDLESAQALDAEIGTVLAETQIYRIDHYLGKETVQNILVFRFANGLFEPIWNRGYVDHVQITVAESIGIEGRGGYYEGAGALRDMVQNHLFQMLSLVAMEPPVSMNADAMRDEKTKVLQSVKPYQPEDVLTMAVRGQYGEGVVDGKSAPAYRAETHVAPDSHTETFVALKARIDNWRWAGVPFYLRTGKRLPSRVTEIAVQFKPAPYQLFRDTPVEHIAPNWLVLHIQPDEGISLQFGAKIPGPLVDIGAVDMEFEYDDYFGAAPSTGYETLLYDCMIGDQMLFQRADTVEEGWRVVMPILDVWQALTPRDFPNYASGTWGPRESEELLERDGREWRDIPPKKGQH